MAEISQTLAFNYALCLANSWQQVKQIFDGLRNAGCGTEEVSVVVPGKETATVQRRAPEPKVAYGPNPQAATVIVRRATGMLMGLGALVIPGVGLFMAAGPIVTAVGAGATACGLAAGLVALGIPEFVAKRYESRLADGSILISIHVANFNEIATAETIIERSGARDVTVIW